MPSYTVSIPQTAAPLVEGALNVVVFAEDAAAARLAAPSAFNNQLGRAPYWDILFAGSTVTENVARADLEGAVLRVQIDATTPIDLSYTGVAADTVDDMAAAMVILLNADAQIANAAYSGTNLLTCADIADNIGDKTLTVTMTLEGSTMSGFVGAIVHEGIAGAVLTCQLATDAIALPQAVASY